MKDARLLDLGVREFGEVWAHQRELLTARQKDEIPDTLLFVEHPHVITAGRSAHTSPNSRVPRSRRRAGRRSDMRVA